MLNIIILGPGCANCDIIEGLSVAAEQFLHSEKPELFENVEVELEQLSLQSDFHKYGVHHTPGLVVNENLATAGRLPNLLEITAVLGKALAGSAKVSLANADKRPAK